MTWQEVRANVREYAKLPDGWDSYGGKAATPATARKALQWAVTMQAVGFPPPAVIGLESTGEFCFEWETPGGHVAFTNTTGHFGAFFDEPGGG